MALRGNAGKARQAQAKRGWGGAGRAARRIGAALGRDRGREGHKKKKTTTSGGLNGLVKGFIGRKRLVLAKDSA